MENLKDRYIINRIGFSECKPLDNCDNIYDCLGYVIINVTKRNQKSFRTDYSDELYKEIPKGWYEYTKNRLHMFALKRIVSILTDNHSFYLNRGVRSFEMLSDSDKRIVCGLLKNQAQLDSERYLKDRLCVINDRLNHSKGRWDKSEDILSKYMNND